MLLLLSPTYGKKKHRSKRKPSSGSKVTNRNSLRIMQPLHPSRRRFMILNLTILRLLFDLLGPVSPDMMIFFVRKFALDWPYGSPTNVFGLFSLCYGAVRCVSMNG